MKYSTGIRNASLSGAGFKAAMDDFVIRVYAASSVPADADAALPVDATLIIEYDAGNGNGTGCTFETNAVNGLLHKNSSEVWSNDTVAAGDPLFFRAVKAADDGSASTTALRVQGTAGVGAVDLQMSNKTLAAGSPQRINSFYIGIPVGS